MSAPESIIYPRSEETERAVLAAVLLDPLLLQGVSAELDDDAWWADRHRVIWQAMLHLQAELQPIDIRTVEAELSRRRKLDAVGGISYLASLDLDLPDVGRLGSYVEILRDHATRRRAIQRAQELIRAAQGDELTADLVAGAEEAYRALGQAATRARGARLGDILPGALERVEDGEMGHLVGIPTGYPALDRLIYGLGRGRLVVIAGRPGMGKTTLATNMLQHVTLREGRPAAMWSLEMSDEELSYRILCSEANVPFDRLRQRHLSARQWERLATSTKRLVAAPLRIYDDPGATVRDIAGEARRLHAQGEVEVLCVDYVQLMSDPSSGGWRGNRNLEIAAISRGLKLLAKELDITVLLLSQLSRDPERRGGDRRPRLGDLRDSGALEQDADLVAFVHREEFYDPANPDVQGLAEVIVAKHRNGPVGTVELAFLGETTTFKPLEDRAASTQPPAPAPAVLPFQPAAGVDPF